MTREINFMAKHALNKTELAEAQRHEAKRLLGQFIVDQAVADQIVDHIIGAAMLEISAIVSDAVKSEAA